jgi:hypothetical protein
LVGSEFALTEVIGEADDVFHSQVFVREMGIGTFSKGRKQANPHFSDRAPASLRIEERLWYENVPH